MTTKTLSPAEGRRVRHPDGRPLAPGSIVDMTVYWERRLDAGDVVESHTRSSKRKPR